MIDVLKFEKECFFEDFDNFIIYSNNEVIRKIIARMSFPRSQTQAISDQSEIQLYKNRLLYEIFDILVKDPAADYFWFGKDGKLNYSLPHHHTIPSNSLRINKQAAKMFIRETKINNILND